MALALIAPGVPMRAGPGQHALWRPIGAAPPPPPPPGGPAGIAGLEFHWDAAQPGSMADAAGLALSAWGLPVARLTDLSANARHALPWRAGAGSAPALATPRLAGTLGGVGRATGAAGTLVPALDPDLGFRAEAIGFGADAAWTRLLVFSRPNRRQASGNDAAPSALLTSGGSALLRLEGGVLRLFPGGANVALRTGLARRHTHSVLLRHTPGAGVDAWVDGAQVASGVANPMPGGTAPPLLLLHDGTPNGAAQCWLHEAAGWSRALAPAEIAGLSSYLSRWPRGPRRGISLLVNGQSNAVNWALNDGAAQLLAQGIAWHLGALAANVVAATGGAAYTLAPGHGLYAALGGALPGSFVQDPGTGADPATWALGADGNATAALLAQLPAEDRADIAAIVWPWSETDSLRAYGEKATFKAAARRFLELERALLGRTAAELPLLWWNAIPYGGAGGIQMHREAVAELAADPALNIHIVNPQTADTIARGASWDPATGLAVGGDAAHRDSIDNQRLARRAAAPAARAILAASGGDAFAAIPAARPAAGGPRILHAMRESATSVLLTVAHDAGTDLKVPLQAASGAGFAVMDGGSVAAPGTLRAASACARVDATHLRLTLSAPLTNPGGLLFYPYGPAAIGRGNAVSDNTADLPPPQGWAIAADLGAAWSFDHPLAATAAPIPLSETP